MKKENEKLVDFFDDEMDRDAVSHKMTLNKHRIAQVESDTASVPIYLRTL